jgi:hypothetical protein
VAVAVNTKPTTNASASATNGGVAVGVNCGPAIATGGVAHCP